MRWFLLGGGGMLVVVLACGAPEGAVPLAPTEPAAAPAPPAAPAPVKRGKKAAAADCGAYCEKYESCAHAEGWTYDPAECARSCRQFAAHPQGGGIITCFLDTPACLDAISCTLGE